MKANSSAAWGRQVEALELALLVVVGDRLLQLRERLVAAHRPLRQLVPAAGRGPAPRGWPGRGGGWPAPRPAAPSSLLDGLDLVRPDLLARPPRTASSARACNTSRSWSSPRSFGGTRRRRPPPPSRSRAASASSRSHSPCCNSICSRSRATWRRITSSGEKSGRSRQSRISSREKPSCRSDSTCCRRATSSAV